ncbi:FkbM family methyltransferase [Maridesulfovibrio hydrothermalis]|uniref:Methyltransferase FkbM domain-containing protein n=1 Tax=Maridesulfovibrio hydrothermalis AM13 = DSM 14728 TaxID=1121451 RepID=L0RIJ0_9BACT|nr:FkbM family methyltransferase [Maridesulfovibrio hydrothermalis]CCO25396.1 protein of unknown function [Maridesulfovibrio hydrothermalis AM13 = DSM 14728]
MDNEVAHKIKAKLAKETEEVIREVESLFDVRDFYFQKTGDWYALKFLPVLGYKPIWKYEPMVRYNLQLKLWESRIGTARFFTSGCPFFEFICELRGYTLPGTISADSVVLDAGPWNGISGMYFSTAARKGKVLFLEPDAESADYIAAEIKRNKFTNTELIQKALYVRDGEIGFQHRAGGASHIIADLGQNVVKTLSLSDLISEYAPEGIDFFKMDIEGVEASIADDLALYINDNPHSWAAIASYHKVNGIKSFVILEKFFSQYPDLVFKTAYPYHETTFVANVNNEEVAANIRKMTSFDVGWKAVQRALKQQVKG